jgi:hypothetical protein
LARSHAWILLTCLAFLSYLIYVDGIERAWWLVLGHGLAWGLLAWEMHRGHFWFWPRPV